MTIFSDASGMPPISQLAYLVPNLDEAVNFWARTLRVGPFRISRHLSFAVCEFDGMPLELDLSIALAWRGDLQIELMQVHSSGKSIFTTHALSSYGFHHVGIHTPNIRRDEERLLAGGFKRLQRSLTSVGVETIYYGGVAGAGMVELIYVPEAVSTTHILKQAAREWDGIDPIAF